MLSSLATFEALSLVMTNPRFIWFGSASVDISTLLENSWLRRGRLCFFVYMKNVEIIESETSSGS